MQNVERLSITPPTEMVRMIQAKVEEGRYASSSEVIRDALHSWQETESLRVQRLDVIRAKIEEADADPRTSLTEAEVDGHFARRLENSLSASKGHA